jgi:hypothetical protein
VRAREGRANCPGLRRLIEELASDVFDAEGPFDNHGRVLVTSEALTRITRSA